MSLNIGTLVGYLQLDDTKFTATADRADKKIDALKLHLDALNKTNPKIKVDTDLKKLDELKARLDALRVQSAKGVDVKVETDMANIELDRLMTKVRSLHNAEIKVNVDDAEAKAKLDELQAKIDKMSLGSKGGLFGNIAAFGPAVLPVINMLPGALFAIGSGAVAGAAGLGVLALAFSGVSSAAAAYNSYLNQLPFATTAKQQYTLKKQLSLSAYGDANPQAQTFARTVISQGLPAEQQIKGAAQAGALPGMTVALQTLVQLTPMVSHLMKSLGTDMGSMATKTAQALNSPFWKQWIVWLGKDAKTQLPLIGGIFGHFFTGLMQAIQRFSPQGTSVLTWLDNLMIKFSNWTGSPQFDKFMATTAADATLVGHALQPLGPILVDLYKGLSATGNVELQVLSEVLKGIASLPVGVIEAIGVALPIVFLGLKSIALASGIATGITKIGEAFMFLSTSEGLAAAAGRGGLIGLGLIGIATAGDRTTKSMSTLQGAVSGAMSGAGLGMFAGPEGAAIGGGIGAIAGALIGLANNTHKAGVEAKTANSYLADYASTLQGLSAATTIDTRRAVVNSVHQNADLFKNLGLNDKVLENAILGRKDAFSTALNAIGKQNGALLAQIAAQRQVVNHAQTDVNANGSIGGRGDALAAAQARLATLEAEQAVAQQLADKQLTQLQNLTNQQVEQRKLNAEVLTYNQLLSLGVPKPIAHIIDTQGVNQDLLAVATLIQRFHVIGDTKWRAILEAEGLEPTKANLNALKLQLQALRSPTVIPVVADTTGAAAQIRALVHFAKSNPAYIPLSLIPIAKPGVAPIHPAAGGTVPGQRSPYGDKVPAVLAPGEEVISNSHGQADRFRPLLKAINAGGMAGGGTVPGDPLAGFNPGAVPTSSKSKKSTARASASKAAAAARARLAAYRKHMQALLTADNAKLAATNAQLAAAQNWSSTFAGNAFSADLTPFETAGPATTSIVNGMKVTQSAATDTSPAGILKAMLAYQKSQQTSAGSLASWVKKLRSEGVSNAVLAQMQAAGPQGLSQIQALAMGTKAQVHAFNASNVATTASLNQTGALATSGQNFSTLQRQQQNELSIQKALKHALASPVPVRVVSGSNHIRP